MTYRKMKIGSSWALKGVRGTFLNTPEDMKWLRDVHLPKLAKRYQSAMVYGNEDCPEHIDCYLRKNPEVYDSPQVWIFETESEET